MATARHNSLSIALASGVMALYLRLVFVTSRWTIRNAGLCDSLNKEPAVVVFWHSRLSVMPHVFRHVHGAHMLISAHRDGELIARTIERLGFATVRGSTARQKPGAERPKDKGGAAALRRMIRIVKNGGAVGITPDGPRGPRMRVSPGTIALAALGGVPLIAASYSSSRAIRFSSWDRFLLPLPFGHIQVEFAGPLRVPERLDDDAAEKTRKALEDMLNQLTEHCDRVSGQDIVRPATETEDGAMDPSGSRKLEQVP